MDIHHVFSPEQPKHYVVSQWPGPITQFKRKCISVPRQLFTTFKNKCQDFTDESLAIGNESRARQRPYIRRPPPCVFAPALQRRDPEDGMLLVEAANKQIECTRRCILQLPHNLANCMTPRRGWTVKVMDNNSSRRVALVEKGPPAEKEDITFDNYYRHHHNGSFLSRNAADTTSSQPQQIIIDYQSKSGVPPAWPQQEIYDIQESGPPPQSGYTSSSEECRQGMYQTDPEQLTDDMCLVTPIVRGQEYNAPDSQQFWDQQQDQRQQQQQYIPIPSSHHPMYGEIQQTAGLYVQPPAQRAQAQFNQSYVPQQLHPGELPNQVFTVPDYQQRVYTSNNQQQQHQPGEQQQQQHVYQRNEAPPQYVQSRASEGQYQQNTFVTDKRHTTPTHQVYPQYYIPQQPSTQYTPTPPQLAQFQYAPQQQQQAQYPLISSYPVATPTAAESGTNLQQLSSQPPARVSSPALETPWVQTQQQPAVPPPAEKQQATSTPTSQSLSTPLPSIAKQASGAAKGNQTDEAERPRDQSERSAQNVNTISEAYLFSTTGDKTSDIKSYLISPVPNSETESTVENKPNQETCVPQQQPQQVPCPPPACRSSQRPYHVPENVYHVQNGQVQRVCQMPPAYSHKQLLQQPRRAVVKVATNLNAPFNAQTVPQYHHGTSVHAKQNLYAPLGHQAPYGYQDSQEYKVQQYGPTPLPTPQSRLIRVAKQASGKRFGARQHRWCPVAKPRTAVVTLPREKPRHMVVSTKQPHHCRTYGGGPVSYSDCSRYDGPKRVSPQVGDDRKWEVLCLGR